MAHRLHDCQGYHGIGEQVQRPVAVPCGRLPQPQGNQLRLGFAIELARCGWLRAFLPGQSPFEAFHNQTFTEILNGLHAAVESLRDLDIRPARPISICLEQNLSATELLC